jgi:hypothetical protein
MPHSDNEITKKEKKLDVCENHLFRSKERGKRCRWVILGQKNDLKPLSSMVKEKENLERSWSFTH